MYKGASETAQLRARRFSLGELARGEEAQSLDQQRDNMIAAIDQIERDLIGPQPLDKKTRAAMCRRKQEVELQLRVVNEQIKKRNVARDPFKDLPHAILTVCKERVSAEAWKAIVAEARRRILEGKQP